MENESPPAVLCAAALVDSLIANAVSEFVLSPGSRSAPLALVLAERERQGLIRLHVKIDERVAGFFALGLVRGAGKPVALVCTSGSAVANLHPAVVEADYSGAPLLLLTADRPGEMRAVGAPQTIDQQEIFGTGVRWFHDMPAPDSGDDDERSLWHQLGQRAVAVTRSQCGPVHLNLGFRPPLVGEVPAEQRLVASASIDAEDGPLAATVTLAGLPRVGEVGEGEFRPELAGRGLVIVGDIPLPGDAGADLAREIVGMAVKLGWPVFAEPTSNLPNHPNVLPHAALIAACDAFMAGHVPELVLSVGRFGLTRSLVALADMGGEHWSVSIDGRGESVDPGLSADRSFSQLPSIAFMAGLSEPAELHPVADMWLRDWQEASTIAAGVVAEAFEESDDLEAPPSRVPPSGVAAALAVWADMSSDDSLFLAASWPIRFIDSYARAGEGQRVLANRGANGIDGLISTSLGIVTARSALASGEGRDPTTQTAKPSVVSLIGDLAFLHDLGGLIGARDLNADLVLVVLNNDGGGIFSQLEQGAPEFERDFERVFGTPHGQDLAAISTAMGISSRTVSTLSELTTAVSSARDAGGFQVVVVNTLGRAAEAALLKRVSDEVCRAIVASMENHPSLGFLAGESAGPEGFDRIAEVEIESMFGSEE